MAKCYINLSGAAYTREAFSDIRPIIRVARRRLKNIDFDTMVGRGLSGAVVVPQLARALGKKFVIVRKSGDTTHTTKSAEGTLGQRWLFVDDFVYRGYTRRTVKRVIAAVAAGHRFDTAYAGTYCYSQDACHHDCGAPYGYSRD